MPEIARVSGIRICVYSRDHLPPHFHASYGEYEVLITIRDGTVYAGELPPRKLRETVKFLNENRDMILDTFYQLNPHLRQ